MHFIYSDSMESTILKFYLRVDIIWCLFEVSQYLVV
jgi:hypothetical protein